MGSPIRRLALAVVAGAVVLAGCASDPTQSAEYTSMVAERDDALARLENVSEQLDDVLLELDQLESELVSVQRTLDDTTAERAALTADLRAADAEISELEERVAALEQSLGAEVILPEIDQEVERVCAQIVKDRSGNAIADAASLISFNDYWRSHVTPTDVESRVKTCAGFDYLIEIALGTEFGDNTAVVRKWVRDVRILVVGSPTEGDLAALDATIADLNRLIDSEEVRRVTSGPAELAVHFIPLVEFRGVIPQYESGNDGFVWIFWRADNSLTNGTVLIRSDGLDQVHRNHLVREELTQAFGMANDSFKYRDSIFQQSFTVVNDYAAIDEVVIALLYRQDVRPGMDGDALRLVLDWQLGG